MAAPLVNGIYYIQNASTGTVLTLANSGSTEDNTPIQASQRLPLTSSEVSTQMWIVVQANAENSVYTLLNAAGKTYADLAGGDTSNYTLVVGFKETGTDSQRWAISLHNDHINYVLKNQYSQTYMDLKGGWQDDGTPVQIWSGDGVTSTNKNQLWNFIRV